NMGAYIGLRRHDLRHFQEQLAALGLSSLGRTERHVLANLDAVIHALGALAGQAPEPAAIHRTALAFSANSQQLQQNTNHLFGNPPAHRAVRIMVTLPSEAAGDYPFVKALVARGMDCARINCAHDTAKDWKQMAAFVRQAAKESGRACKVLMDLAGPKLRTGTLASGHHIIHLKPKRDERGAMLEPCRVILDCSGQPGRAASKDGLGRPVPARLSVEEDWFRRIGPGDHIEFTDLRGKHGTLVIAEVVSPNELLATCDSSAYLEEGTLLQHFPHPKKRHPVFESALGTILPAPLPVVLKPGDALLLTRADTPGEPAELDEADNSIIPAHIACAQPAVLDSLQVGQRVLIDDGHIGSVVEALNDDGALLRITHARELGARLGPEKGLNFPDTDLQLPALTDKDRADLACVAKHADIVGYSFVQSAEDMEQLLAALDAHRANKIGVIAKIETRLALSNLPEIIVRGAGRHPFGVMIARGDLAVEVGYEKLAETQEEIMWLCEAAHVPVIWATQVLESLVKQNIPTRAEVTDAAMAERAECIMLNKGPFVLDAIDVLDHLVARMQSHQTKKTARMRTLHW
ncbi:MAG TPA: pyruvate kinase, partial [Gallionellaceae bacterium]|nr:pyruvate kinase [Gallionellaceae bacterium]